MEVFTTPMIMPIQNLRKTSEISELAHKKQEPKVKQKKIVVGHFVRYTIITARR